LIDLPVDRGPERIGFEFKCALAADRKDWSNLKGAISEGIIRRGCVVNLGERGYPAADDIEVVSGERLIRGGLGRTQRNI
jgi:hypothetical protein